MKCPECEKRNMDPGIIRQDGPAKVGADISLIEYFFDDKGKEHGHNSNPTVMAYTCNNGHSWQETLYPTCWCGWSTGKKE